jgi:predicted transcriptional regulator
LLMYSCNLSFKQTQHYLGFMLRKKLLRVVPGDNGANPGLYEITDKGRAFLKSYKALKALME